MSQVTSDTPEASVPVVVPEVLTLAEAAEYLRVSQSDVIDLATRRGLPGRKIGEDWRFHKQGLANWLCEPELRDFWQTQFGALRDDSYMEQMVKDIYEERGHPIIKED